MKRLSLSAIFCLLVFTCYAQHPGADQIDTENGPLTIQPIQHGTLVLEWNDKMIYVDPTSGAEAFEGLDVPDLILITHAHPDHLSPETLEALDTEGVPMIVPQSVADKLPGQYSDQLVILANGDDTNNMDIAIHAMAMYNLPESDDAYHPKGWGNGYVMNIGGKNVYISGDTEDIPEMRSLENIDVAFVCMNLPYTMTPEQAADAVLDFKPAIVYPYHYKGQDTEKFKQLVTEGNDEIDVRLRNWYMGS